VQTQAAVTTIIDLISITSRKYFIQSFPSVFKLSYSMDAYHLNVLER